MSVPTTPNVTTPPELRKNVLVRATYIWVGNTNTYTDIRGKDRTVSLPFPIALAMVQNQEAALPDTDFEVPIKYFSEWNFDGSSTGQASPSADTEIILRPVRIFQYRGMKPLRVIVLCECFFPDGTPTPCNTRALARRWFEDPEMVAQQPWYGLEQEYILLKDGRPLGWPSFGYPPPQGPYYCGTGADRAFGRSIIDAHYERCLDMGIKVSGTNGEVTPGQWEFQVGPCAGLEAGDHMIVARWVYLRLLEELSERDHCTYTINYEPKPIKGDWNGSGMHCNFSTVETRDERKITDTNANISNAGENNSNEIKIKGAGMAAIMRYINNMRNNMAEDLAAYGKNNNERLSGTHETSSMSAFTYGVGTRNTSLRIPNQVQAQGHGYYEDRRPAGNADPYAVTTRILLSALGKK